MTSGILWIVSYEKMLGQLTDAGNTTTLAHYLHVLAPSFLCGGLPKFSRGITRSKASSPKLIVFKNAANGKSGSYFARELDANRILHRLQD